MEAPPVLGNEALAPAGEEPPDPESAPVEEYVAELEAEKVEALDAAGIEQTALVASFDYAANGFSALLTAAEAEVLADQKGVLRVQRDELRQLETSHSPHFLGLDDRNGAWDSGFTGAGVIVGVIDTGIWPEHPSFADSGLGPPPDDWMDGAPICEFGDTGYNPDDVPFACNNKLIGARDMRSLYEAIIGSETYTTARDYDGHGTHTASTATGNRDVEASIFGREFGEISGIAPDAWVAAYSACGDQGCFGGDLADAVDQAVADGVDVINYSIGSSSPSLTGPDDIAFLFAANARVFAATSAGNAGPAASTLGSPGTVPWITTVGASTQKKTYLAEARTGDSSDWRSRWSRWFKRDQGKYEGASITPGTGGQLPLVDAADLGNELCDPDVAFTGDITGKVVLCLRGVQARVEKSRAVFEAGGAGMVLYNPDDTQDLVTDNHWVPSVHINFTDGSAIKQYIADSGDEATVEITDGETERQRGNTMAAFSSRGPIGVGASDDIIKPDVTAPGVNILAGNSMTPTLGAPDELFQSISGTSMASPHVAGLFALLKQAHPDWTPAMAKSALMTTARQDVRKEDGTTRADPFDFGAGHIDPEGRVTRDGSIFNPGLVYNARTIDYVAFFCDTADAFVVPLLVGATCQELTDLGFQTLATNLNYPSIAASEVAGSKTVIRTVTNVSDESETYRARVDEPSGFDVTVSPDQITVAPGESATFEVTFVNEDAPLDEWRFGSLTWQAGRNRVRSPIAVKAAALDFPDFVNGTGAEGAVSIPLQFGYTGTYAAAPHGLAADAPIAGTVTQDPDQSFSPADNGNGATPNPINVAGTAFLRIALNTADLTPPNGAIDLDLFLLNSAGEVVASSGAGSTDELIELEAPLDDTYTLWVHGWQTTGIEVGYNLHVWQVPATPGGGSLIVNSAPPSATLNAVGTVEAGWSGLAVGDYLGAVSHSDGTTTFGYTLVEVDNTP
jgi:subtilisin family serine protease